MLTINSTPAIEPLVQPDIAVRLRWVQHPNFVSSKWFTLHADPGDTLLLAGGIASSLVPESPLGFDYAPLGVELVEIGCLAFDDPSGCGIAQRQALELTWDNDVARISDGNFGFIGQLVSYEVVVETAIRFLTLGCDSSPETVEALFVLIPEG